MELKHTPGPWRVNTHSGRSVMAGNNCIALCDTDAVPEEQERANARLIAHAPALLAEAIELLNNATYQDGHGTILTQDAEALLATIDAIVGGNGS